MTVTPTPQTETPTRASYPDDATLVLERVFAAPPEAVFDAFAVPEQLAAWFGPEGTDCHIHDMEVSEGGVYRLDMRSSEGNVYELQGVYVTIERPTRLSFTWRWVNDPSSVETLVTIDLSKRAGGTALRLTHTRFSSVESRGMHEQGWTSTFDELARFAG